MSQVVRQPPFSRRADSYHWPRIVCRSDGDGHVDRSHSGPRHDTDYAKRIWPMNQGSHERSDDIAYPSSIGFVLIHVGCFAAIWTGLTWRAKHPTWISTKPM